MLSGSRRVHRGPRREEALAPPCEQDRGCAHQAFPLPFIHLLFLIFFLYSKPVALVTNTHICEEEEDACQVSIHLVGETPSTPLSCLGLFLCQGLNAFFRTLTTVGDPAHICQYLDCVSHPDWLCERRHSAFCFKPASL